MDLLAEDRVTATGPLSPELESSLELPRPLARDEKALIKYRMRSPLVHMRGDGYVTTLPLTGGAFRERVWLPSFGGAPGAAGVGDADIEFTIATRHHRFCHIQKSIDAIRLLTSVGHPPQWTKR